MTNIVDICREHSLPEEYLRFAQPKTNSFEKVPKRDGVKGASNNMVLEQDVEEGEI